MKRNLLVLIPALALALTAACSRSTNPEEGSGTSSSNGRSGPVSMNKEDYPVFPDDDAAADPSVPAEQGGKGFTGEGWETNTAYDLIGDPHAVKGGVLRETVADFPSTLRLRGPNTTSFSSILLAGLVYETILGMHPTTLEYIPALASHWQISADKATYRFRMDPNARWADGQPVTADDVVASWSLWMDKGLNDPALPLIYGKFEKPVAESKYIVRVKTIKPNWRNFMYFSGMSVLPAHILKNLDGATFVRDYNFKMVPGTGPYAVNESDVDKGKTIRIKRRQDYWAEKQRRNVGANNFDEINVVVVRDRNLEFEMFKKGDLDYYYVNRAQMWEEELNFPEIGRGVILKRRIWNHYPQGVQGLAINTRRSPYDDVRVRKALRHLFNREQMIEKLMYGAYTANNSLYPGSMWENPGNEKLAYDPQKALQLLSEAGFTARDPQGRLTRRGTPLVVELLYPQKESERFLTIFQEDLRKVGVTLNLRLVTFETLVKLLDELQFDMVSIGYTGIPFPNPETSLLSSLADQKNNNNITGFKNQRVDELIGQYDVAYEIPERVKIIREVDALFTDAHHWIFEWYAPYWRIAFWNKFGFPKGHITRTGNYQDMVSLWWIDPAKSEKLNQARRDSSSNLGQGEVEDKYWMEFAKTEDKLQF